jgi:hypothetical protein
MMMTAPVQPSSKLSDDSEIHIDKPWPYFSLKTKLSNFIKKNVYQKSFLARKESANAATFLSYSFVVQFLNVSVNYGISTQSRNTNNSIMNSCMSIISKFRI